MARTFGIRGARLRAVHEARRRLGRFRPAPRHRASPSAPAEWLRIDAEALRAATDRDAALARARRVADGEHHAFRATWRPMPDNWHRHPDTGRVAASDRPWWEAEHLDRSFGDIKDVWEPARFGWLYDLVRAYVLTGDDAWAAVAAQRVRAWAASSPPFQGLHWSCGQETAIRAIALMHAEANLTGATSWEPVQPLVADVLAASGERIADAIGYAVSQRNNHAISEATGLVLLGARFGGSHPEAGRWLDAGRRWLETVIPEQIAPDGWYIQHSFTYARVALDQCVWAEHALRARGQRLSDAAAARIGACADLLALVADPDSGAAPNHGPNDGALVFPVSLGTYRDLRPVLTAVAATWGRTMGGLRPDPEVSVWIGVDPPEPGGRFGDGVWSGVSGWAVARVGPAFAFLRAGRYTSRPGHLDALHLDVRFGGREVVVDAGTYSYNAAPPWNDGLKGEGVHNGPQVSGHAPGVRGPRFLWYLWPEADVVACRMEGDHAVLVGERPGVARRTIRVFGDRVEVHDEAQADAPMTVRWLLAPGVAPECVRVEGGARVEAAVEGDVVGWVSDHYGVRIPSQAVVAGPAGPSAGGIVTAVVPPTL